MSEPHSSKKNKTQPGSEKKRDGTPRKMTKTRSTHKGERLMAFTLTYKDLEDDDADNFLVTRPEKDSGMVSTKHMRNMQCLSICEMNMHTHILLYLKF